MDGFIYTIHTLAHAHALLYIPGSVAHTLISLLRVNDLKIRVAPNKTKPIRNTDVDTLQMVCVGVGDFIEC